MIISANKSSETSKLQQKLQGTNRLLVSDIIVIYTYILLIAFPIMKLYLILMKMYTYCWILLILHINDLSKLKILNYSTT